ncbi:hypothetical protein [Oricola sp.]|uniref:hypothetical protein n=1 Tax=Oricola sp. TaxID=1979950 RepID=UPI002600AD72|nr:hypothetical protein [Oricola sp.]MCI5073960.1 hypothetical protein [Oricola sp.]
MDLSDIRAAIERGIVSDLEDAFRALVGWPGEDEIAGADATERQALLERICDALRDDDRQMPGGTREILEDAAADLRGGRYCDGALAVLADLDHWRTRLGDRS